MALIQWKQIDGSLSGSRVLTGSLNVSGGLDLTGSFTFNGADFINGIFSPTGSYYATTNDIKVTGSFDLNLDGIEDYFSVSVNGEEKIKVNKEGVLEMKSQSIAPTAAAGGMYYSASNEFFLGFLD
jgi:hypothetical protein|tara:strand:- start:268 stop:645 length:378 start_codon:yes stop_codon:yes gene_type:complete